MHESAVFKVKSGPRPLMEGGLEALPLPDLLHVLSLQTTARQILTLKGRYPIGVLWLHGRELLLAQTDGLNGPEALYRLYRERFSGGFRVFNLDAGYAHAKVNGSKLGDLQELLLSCAIREDREAMAPVRREAPRETFSLASAVAEELEDTVPLFRPPADPHATRRIEFPAGALPPDPWDLTQ